MLFGFCRKAFFDMHFPLTTVRDKFYPLTFSEKAVPYPPLQNLYKKLLKIVQNTLAFLLLLR